MYRKQRRLGDKRRSLIGWLFAKRIRERVCQTCGVPFLEHPDREPFKRFKSRNLELVIFDDYSFGKRKYFWMVGSWKLEKQNFYFSKLVDLSELKDLLSVALEAMEEFKVNHKVVLFRGNELEMSPSLPIENKETNGGLWK